MSAATDYLESKLVGHIFTGTTFTAPSELHYALFTVKPADDGTGGTEVSGGSYARVQKDPGTTHWEETPTGTASNKTVVTFPAPTADWGTVAAVGIYDASSSGNLLVCEDLTQSKVVSNGDDAPSFPIGQFTVTFA